jgi:alpha-beta hydrolase superfamily lysophospholipase
LAALEDFLAAKEAGYPNLIPGTAKSIVWHGGKRERAALALVYVHGFGASRQEISPVMERLAEDMGANLFFTRLKGHGLGPEGFRGLGASDWVDDLSEALAVGHAIGDRVIVAATSTGAALAVWAASTGAAIDGLILVSPNFRLAAKTAAVLAWPWGRLWLRLFVGEYRRFIPVSELQERYWTCTQHTDGLLAMMGAVLLAQSADLSRVTTPTLVLYTEKDDVVSAPEIKGVFERLGSRIKEIHCIANARHHVLAGAATCPEAVDEVQGIMAGFISAHP